MNSYWTFINKIKVFKTIGFLTLEEIFSYTKSSGLYPIGRNNIKQRQAEGIRIVKEKGVKFGMPKIILPSNTNEILKKYINKEIKK